MLMKPWIILLMLCLTLISADAKTEGKGAEEVDLVSLAALLTTDGFYNRANDTLNQVDTTKKNFNFAYFYTLRGIVAMKLSDYKSAVGYFRQALENGQNDKSIYLYIAESSYKLQAYHETIEALDSAGELASDRPNLVAFRAETHWKLEEYDRALGTLERGYEKFPDHHNFVKQRFFYFVQLSLFQEALATAQQFLADAQTSSAVKVDADTYLAFATALRSSKEHLKAITMLEEGRLRFPYDARLTVLLAHMYVDKGKLLSAANLFENASYYEQKYTKEASELYRRAKSFVHALYLNSQVLDQQEKLKQRLAIFVEFGEYDRATAMHTDLERNGLLENEDLRYALAYTYYMAGDYAQSEALLKTLTKSDLFSKAVQLRNNMEKCKNNRWDCI